MNYSRIMMMKAWGLCEMDRYQVIPGWGNEPIDLWAEPQKKIHSMVVDPLPKKLIKWIDKNGQIQEAEI